MAGLVKCLPNKESIRLGENIRFLRKQSGHSQKELGDILHVSDKCISHFERGIRRPSEEYLRAIASHYGVSVEMLLMEQITAKTLSDATDIVTHEYVTKAFHKVHIRFHNANATQNINFQRATELHLRYLSGDEDFMDTMLTSCRDRYYRSFKESNVLAGAANTLMLLIVEYTNLGITEEDLDTIQLDKMTEKELYCWTINIQKKYAKERKAFLESTEDMYDECLMALRNNSSTLSIAEYFLGLRYIFNMVDNPLDYEDNMKIGSVLLLEFSNLGNKYAERYLTLYDEK